jgi:hypothetical protein
VIIPECTPRSRWPRRWRSTTAGRAADADLEGGAVGHQARDELCYRYIDIAGRLARILGGRPRGAHDHVDLAAAQPAVAADVRHLVVDLGDHRAGPADERGQVVRGQA